MSRAFLRDDPPDPPGPVYDLPAADDPGFAFAAARALLTGARAGDTIGAEAATGMAWGAPVLVPHVRAILAEARADRDDRLEQLAERFLRQAGVPVE
jgi:hypothetical protein